MIKTRHIRYVMMVALLCLLSVQYVRADDKAQYTMDPLMKKLSNGTVFSKKNDTEKILKATLVNLVNNTQATSIATGNALMIHARAVFTSIVGLILAAQITFIGFRIMLKESVVQALTELTVSSFILLVVSGLATTQKPIKIIETAMYQMTAAGRNVGSEIIAGALGSSTSGTTIDPTLKIIKEMQKTRVSKAKGKDMASITPTTSILDEGDIDGEPGVYWMKWIGVDNAYPGLNNNTDLNTESLYTNAVAQGDDGKEYKFSQASLMCRFWGETNLASTLGPDVKEAKDHADAEEKKRATEKEGKGIVTSLDDIAQAIMTASSPLRLLGMAMTIGTIQTGATLAPVMQQVGVFVGAFMTFYVVAALGISTLPLIYFKSYRSLWSSYLTVVAGIALIPCFYYIFSAIGFVFAANTFEALFPLTSITYNQAAPQSFAVILNTVYMRTMLTSLSIGAKLMGPFSEAFAYVVSFFFAWSMVLGRVTFASGVIASVVTGGVGFAMMGGQIAYRWAQGFGAESMTDKIGEFFTGIQGSVGSGLSAMYSNFVNRGSEALGGYSSGAGGRH